jgi:hypothetical protein
MSLEFLQSVEPKYAETLYGYCIKFGNEIQMTLNAYLRQINHSFCSAHPISTNL